MATAIPRYDAFISYSHAADSQLASRLESALQRFAKPWYKLREMAVFRDGNNLNLTPALWSSIQSALDEARHLVLLASPESARSVWVEREVQHWLDSRGVGSLILVVTGGELAWDAAADAFDWNRTDCLPHALQGAFREEPFYLDLRWARDESAKLTLRDPTFASGVALLSATLHGRSVEDMVGAEVAQHRRMTLWRNAAIASLSVLLAAAVSATWVAEQQRRTAEAERLLAVEQRERAESVTLLTRVRSALESGLLAQAVRTALGAAQRFPSLPATAAALNSVGLNSGAVLMALNSIAPHVRTLEVSADGQRILTLSADTPSPGSVAEARVYDVLGRQLLVQSSVSKARLVDGGRRWLRAIPGAPFRMPDTHGPGCGATEAFQIVDVDAAPSGSATAARKLGVGFADLSADGQRVVQLCGTRLELQDADGSRRITRVPDAKTARLSPDGRTVAVERATSVWLIDTVEWFPVASAGEPPPDAVPPPAREVLGRNPVFAADSRRVVTELGATSALWHLDGRELDRRPGRSPRPGPGDTWFTESVDGTLKWSPGASTPVRLDGRDVQVSADGQWLLTSLSATDALRVASIDGHALATVPGRMGRFSPLGPSVVAADASGAVRIWDLRRLGLESPAAAAGVWEVADATARKELADTLTGLMSEAARVVADRGNLPLPGCVIPEAQCSRDGLSAVAQFQRMKTPGRPGSLDIQMVSLSRDGGGNLAAQIVPLASTLACPTPATAIAYSPVAGGPWAVGCQDGTVHLVDRTGRLRWSSRHPGPITTVAWSPDGRTVFVGTGDRTAVLLGADDGQPGIRLPAHDSAVVRAVFDLSAHTVATLTRSGTAWAWSIGAGSPRLLGSIRVEGSRLAALHVDREARWLYGATTTQRLHRWSLNASRDLSGQYPWLSAETEAEQVAPGQR